MIIIKTLTMAGHLFIRIAYRIASKPHAVNARQVATGIWIIGQNSAIPIIMQYLKDVLPAHRNHTGTRRRWRESEPVGGQPQIAFSIAEYFDGHTTAAKSNAGAAGRMGDNFASIAPIAHRGGCIRLAIDAVVSLMCLDWCDECADSHNGKNKSTHGPCSPSFDSPRALSLKVLRSAVMPKPIRRCAGSRDNRGSLRPARSSSRTRKCRRSYPR